MKKLKKSDLSPYDARILRHWLVFLFQHSAHARLQFEKAALSTPEKKSPKRPTPKREHPHMEFVRSVSLNETLAHMRMQRQTQKPNEEAVKPKISKHHQKNQLLKQFKNIYTTSRAFKLAFIFLMLCNAVVLVQLSYPQDRTLPFARLEANGYVGFDKKSEILNRFQDFDRRYVKVHTHNKTFTTSYADLGVSLRAEQTVDKMQAYSLQQRLVPFSIIFAGNKKFQLDRELNESQMNLFFQDIALQTNKEPKNVTVTLEGTKLQIVPSEEGYRYEKDYLRSLIMRSDLRSQGEIVFKPTVLYPQISTDAARNVAVRMQERINSPLTITAEGKSMVIDSATLASWVDIAYKPEAGSVEIGFNKQRVTSSLRAFPTMVDASMQPMIATYLNGSEAGRTQGRAGKSVQFEELVNMVTSTTSATTTTIPAPLSTTVPTTVIDRKYSRDSAGLQNLISFWTANNKGSYSIDIRTLNGRIQANSNPYRLFSSVGVYRIYLASAVYGHINARSLSGSTMTSTGLSVDACLDRMLRESNEACSNALGNMVGWDSNDYLLHQQGFENTTLVRGAGLTTANDTADWLTQLINGGLTTRSQADSVVSMMSRHTQRSGIPAGSPGVRVANIAGSFGNYKHDIAIVYHPQGTYVLSIFSEGSTYPLIADLSKEIYKTMSQ
jgi:hypothetical protein